MSQIQATPEQARSSVLLLAAQTSWERFSYYGMRALLVLYLIRPRLRPEDPAPTWLAPNPTNPGRGWSESDANLFYGWFAGLIFLLPVLTGYLSHRVLGDRRSVLLGGITMILGLSLLAAAVVDPIASSPYEAAAFVASLFLIVLGTGYFRPGLELLESRDPATGNEAMRRAKLWNIRVNLGVLACVLLCGTLAEEVGWSWGFAALAVTMIPGCVFCRLAKSADPSEEQSQGSWIRAALFLFAGLIFAALAGWIYQVGSFGWLTAYGKALWQNDAFRNSLPASIGPLVLGVIVWYVAVQERGYKAATAGVLVLLVFYGVFWFAFHQIGSTLNEFAERSVNRRIPAFSVPVFGKQVPEGEMPVTWIQALNVLLILLLAPIFARFGSSTHGRASHATMAGVALFLIGLSFGVLTFAISQINEGAKVALPWLVAAVVIMTAAELALVPTGLSFVRRLVPSGRPATTLAAVSFVFLFLGNLSGGILASYADSIERGDIRLPWYRWFRFDAENNPVVARGWADFFFLLVVTSLAAGVLALAFAPLYRRLTAMEQKTVTGSAV